MQHLIRRTALAAASIAALGAVGVLGAIPASASPTTTTYVKAFDYQFASNTGLSAAFEMSDSPLAYTDASQSLGATGVSLSASGSHSESSAVIVLLGRLDTLFNGAGKYVPPTIVGTGGAALQYNLYFDTNADHTYFNYSESATQPVAFTSLDGDDAVTMGDALGATSDLLPAGGSGGFWFGSASTVPNLHSAANMEQLKADYASNPNHDTNPLVWAWIGTNAGTGGAISTVTVKSVNGRDLVEAVTSSPSASPSPSPSASSSPAVPKGAVQTGGGKPIPTPWLPFGLGLAVFGGLALAGCAVALRKQRD